MTMPSVRAQTGTQPAAAPDSASGEGVHRTDFSRCSPAPNFPTSLLGREDGTCRARGACRAWSDLGERAAVIVLSQDNDTEGDNNAKTDQPDHGRIIVITPLSLLHSRRCARRQSRISRHCGQWPNHHCGANQQRNKCFSHPLLPFLGSFITAFYHREK